MYIGFHLSIFLRDRAENVDHHETEHNGTNHIITWDMESPPEDSIFEIMHEPKSCVANKDGKLDRSITIVIIKLNLSEPVTIGT